MKRFVLLSAFAGVCFLQACKKDDPAGSFDPAVEQDLAGKQAMAEYTTDDIFDMVMVLGAEKPELGARPGEELTGNSFLDCAAVSLSGTGFPKTLTIDFGDSCVAPNGVVRRGIINVVISDSLRLPGSTATTTFNNYYINQFKKEGTIVWTNQSTATTRKWNRTVTDGKMIAPNGNYWLHNGTKTSELISDVNPNTIIDNIWQITGSGSTTNPASNTRSHTITVPLIKKAICPNIVQGTVQITGPAGTSSLNYGDGNCDNVAQLALPNGNIVNITLP